MLASYESILAAAKVPADVPNPEEIASYICNDGEVRDIAMRLAIDSYVLEAVSRVQSLERLHKRVGVPQPAPVPVKPKITWHIEGSTDTFLYILGKRDNETMRFFTPDPNVTWYGEKIPQYVLAELERQLKLKAAKREADEEVQRAAERAQKNPNAAKPRIIPVFD